MKMKELFSDVIISGDFNKLEDFDFEGVYIICDKNDEIVYIGSAYGRPIKERLQQYLHKKDSGNTLGHAIAKSLSNSEKYDDKAKEKMEDALDMIKTFKIKAIKHYDLEYFLIKTANPKYNKNGTD